MALRVGALRFDVVADTSKLKKGMEQARKEMDKTQRAAARAGGGRGGSKTVNAQAQWAKTRIMATAMVTATATLAASVGSLILEMNRHADAMKDLMKEWRRMRGFFSFGRLQGIRAAADDPFRAWC